ncbi:flavin monoamine oxidase family protein [Kineothrix sp. MB12-C1]|uniref:flavin monoamine oxidase family protein n=1 Tax=Kineothrix sp. MB12-C1 TaxID=3070215 RepID=UPI0027D2E1A8|nr:NAD(P)/FAD-dependent oxidoreductase [Kineothrix sp. MB12-C1]WMC93483.1 FAD-dependent oxidoreductase [Kineothrix sp. MB12-C1]
MSDQTVDYLTNPSDSTRYEILRNAFTNAGRPEDFENVIELLNPPPDITTYAAAGAYKNLKVGIIGAGLAGLSAAFELRKLGAEITLYDAMEDRIGGRVYTYYFDRDRRYYGEFGPMRIPISHGTAWHYINLLHLNTISITSPFPNNFIYVHNTRIRRDPAGDNITKYLYPLFNLTEYEKSLPWPELNDYAFDSVLLGLPPDIRRELLQILPTYSPEYSFYLNKSIREILEMRGLSQDAINLIASTDPLTGGLLNTSYGEVLQELYSMDYLNTYRIEGGMINLPLAFYNSLISRNPSEYDIAPDLLGNVNINFGHNITGIYRNSSESKVILRYNNSYMTNIYEEFDYVICTIPFSTLREVDIRPFFRNQKMQAIRELFYTDSFKAAFFCNRRFWEEDTVYGRMNGGISFTDLPIQSIIYPSDHIHCTEPSSCSPSEPGVLISSYNINQDSVRVANQSEGRRLSLVKRNVEEVHGLPENFLDTIVESYKMVDWNRQEWFRGGFAVNLPGQKINFAYTILEPEYNNRVFFAGEHTSVKKGWMQGSLYSGMLAANTLAMNLR